MTSASKVLPALLLPFLAWRVYRRARRNIGRQPLRSGRLGWSIGIFTAIVAILGAFMASHPAMLAALGGGLLAALPVAWLGWRLTKFETSPAGDFYTPNTYLGIVVSLLFVGRIAYRMMVLADVGASVATAGTPPTFQSPLTLFFFGLTAGYYIAYQAGVLWLRHRAHVPASPGPAN